MLKNKTEREAFLKDENNWSEVFENNSLGIRLLRFVVGDIYRLEVKTNNPYFGEHWTQCGYTKYSIIKNGCHNDINNTNLLDLIRKM